MIGFHTFPNFLDNGFEGNFWSGYNGSDVNCDGLGDTRYVLDENLTDNHPLVIHMTSRMMLLERQHRLFCCCCWCGGGGWCWVVWFI